MKAGRYTLVLLGIALLGCSSLEQVARAQDRQGPLVGKPAPEFHVQGIFNEPFALDTFKGHILVMQFGSSW